MRISRMVTATIAVLLFTAASFGAHQGFDDSEIWVDLAPSHNCHGSDNLTCGGRVFYINPVHHVASYQNSNVAEIMRNAVRYVSPYTVGSISTLVFANALDRAQAIYDSLVGQPDISPSLTTDQNDLLSLSSYDVVVVQSNGYDFSPIVEQSLADFANNSGGVIGGHDVIWNQNNNPVLNEVFGAIAYGDGSNPGNGWFKGTVTVLKALDSPITKGIASSWSLIDEEYFFDVQFNKGMLVILETNHSGDLIPVAWTLLLPQIEAPANLTAQAIGNDMKLEWDNPNSSQVAHHWIYRVESPTAFDFSDPIHETSGDLNPKLEEWTDIGAASSFAPREYYYVVRAVNVFGVASPTSLTAGKWTRHFDAGLNAFSLPLKPFEPKTISWLANDIAGVITLDWLDMNGNWVRYDLNSPNVNNDTTSETGSTYQLYLSGNADYTFVGYPGTTIRYMDRLGNLTSFLRFLTLDIQANDVALNWVGTPGATRYHIFRSESREGVFNLSSGPIGSTTLTTYVDPNVLNGFTGELFYAIIAEDDQCGLGSSSYSKGLVKKEFHRGINSFALELTPPEQHTLDWYSSAIGAVEGVAYVTNSTWKFHADLMPPGVYDAVVEMTLGYQVSVRTELVSFVYLGA